MHYPVSWFERQRKTTEIEDRLAKNPAEIRTGYTSAPDASVVNCPYTSQLTKEPSKISSTHNCST
jgi:hypothetical protein